MKIFLQTLIIVSIFTQGCEVKKNGINHFSSLADTLIIRTEKQKDRGPFLSSHVPINFEAMTQETMKDFIFPSGISQIKAIHLYADYADEEPNYVDIISGILNDEEIFIVDENNNNDFRDDSVRTIKKLRRDSPEGLVKCKYLISDGREIVEDSSWIQIREDHNTLWLGFKEHLTADTPG